MKKLPTRLIPVTREMALERIRKRQELHLHPHQGVDMSHDDLIANANYEISHLFAEKP